MNEWMNEWNEMNEWMNAWMDEWISEWMTWNEMITLEGRRVYRRLAIVSWALSVLLASQVPGPFFVCFIRFYASGPPWTGLRHRSSLGSLWDRFWDDFGVHLGSILGSVWSHFWTKVWPKTVWKPYVWHHGDMTRASTWKLTNVCSITYIQRLSNRQISGRTFI